MREREEGLTGQREKVWSIVIPLDMGVCSDPSSLDRRGNQVKPSEECVFLFFFLWSWSES